MRRNTKVIPLARSKVTADNNTPVSSDGIPLPFGCDYFGNLFVRLVVGGGGGGGGLPQTLEAGGDDVDNVTEAADGRLFTDSRSYLYNGVAEWDRGREASATNIASLTALGAALMAMPGNWSAFDTPAANTIATCTRASAGANNANVCNSIAFSVNAVGAIAGTLLVVLRDGATGVGAILWSQRVGPFAANGSENFAISGLNIVGSLNTAMTLEFTAAPGATEFESVAMTGFAAVT